MVGGGINDLRRQNPDFNAFFNELQRRTKNFVSPFYDLILSLLGFTPGRVGTVASLLDLFLAIVGLIRGDGDGAPPPLTPAYGFIGLLVGVMHAYPAGAEAVYTVLTSRLSLDDRLEAIRAIVTGGLLVNVPSHRDAGLTAQLYNRYLERVAAAYQESIIRYYRRFILHYTTAIWGLANPNMTNPENYVNLFGGFIVLVDLIQAGWRINRTPAVWAHLHDPQFFNLIHVIATKDIAEYGRVTVFVHVQAKLGVNEVESVADNIMKIAREGSTWAKGLRLSGDSRVGDCTQGRCVTVLVAFSVEPGAVTQLMVKLQELSDPCYHLVPCRWAMASHMCGQLLRSGIYSGVADSSDTSPWITSERGE